MKILVVSLLRLGDILLTTPVLRGLRSRHPEAEIHVMINKSFVDVSELIPFVNRFVLFDREAIQRGLGEADRPLFEPYERISSLLRSLNREDYDLVVNLTHNRLSGWLVSQISCGRRIGLSLDRQGQPHFGSPWFRYLNEKGSATGEDAFHFVDVFLQASEIMDDRARITVVETSAGREEAEKILGHMKEFIAVQPFSSDAKKDWGVDRIHETLKIFSLLHPEIGVVILGAPSERSRLDPLIDHLHTVGVPARLAICSLSGAYSLLRKARALLTGDTSIKHLACAARTRVVELSLGSSDYRRTGAYAHGAVILQSRETCAPCVHSSPCHRSSHLCATRLQPECVASVLSLVCNGDEAGLVTVAEEFKEDVLILKTDLKATGYWAAVPLAEPLTEAAVGRWLDLAGWKLLLERVDDKGLGEYGSEGFRLGRLLRTVFPDVGPTDWRHFLEGLENHAERVGSRIEGFASGLDDLRRNYENPERLRSWIRGLQGLRERVKTHAFLRSGLDSLDSLIEDEKAPAFVRVRRISDAVNNLRDRARIELKLIRVLQRHMEDYA